MRVLVIGGTRFIGRAIVTRLLREGHEVTLLNRGLSKDPFGTRVRRLVGDRRNHETVLAAANKRDFDALIDITAYHENETANVVEAFKGRIGHLFHISTASVYLIRDEVFAPYLEDQFSGPVIPRQKGMESTWFYSHHKRCCEEVLQQAWQEHRFPYTALRLPMMVGPHDYTARADAYLERLISGGPVILPEGGLNTWGFLWVDDVAEVITSNLGKKASHGQAYNLAQREAISLRQLVETAAALIDCNPQIIDIPSAWLDAVGIGTSFSPYSHDRDILLDCQRAERDLLFRPTPAITWIEQLVEDFRQRWDGVARAFATTRHHELALAQELAKIQLPVYQGKS
jgi:nucleoside-diphosphate-sugar epimerase